ncbi:MAG: hypothetical protein ABI639_06375 [Thermoanaerobaculia bacterium]
MVEPIAAGRVAPSPPFMTVHDDSGFDWTARIVSAEAGFGPVFDNCPLCRELASQCGPGQKVEAVVGVGPANRETYAALIRAEWIDSLLDLVGRNAVVRVMGRNMEKEPLEELSMESFLERIGYEG